MKHLKNRNAILTGASRGLGVHIAEALAKEGVNMVLAARSAGKLEKVCEDVRSFGVRAVSIPTDLTDPGQLEALVEKSEEKLGPIDILINNAGVEYSTPFEQFEPEKIRKTVELNLTAPMLLTRSVLSGMLERGSGHIVNMSSLAGKIGFPCETPYAAVKSGLVKFTHSLRVELAGKSVGVSVICPGFVAGDGMYARMEKESGPAPKMLIPTTTEKVADSVIKAIKKDSAERIVNRLPMRPVLILQEMFPGIIPYLHRALGTPEYGRKISERGI